MFRSAVVMVAVAVAISAPTYASAASATSPTPLPALQTQLLESLASLLKSFRDFLANDQNKINVPQQIAAGGSSSFAGSGRIDTLSNTTIQNPTITGGSISAASIIGTLTGPISSAIATIDNLTANTIVATNGSFGIASTTNLVVSGPATSTFTGGASLLRVDTTGTSTLYGAVIGSGGLRLSSQPCNSFGNGGKITTDAQGNLICATDQGGSGSSVGGSDTQVQFNDGGSFSGNNGFTFDKIAARATFTFASTSALTVLGSGYFNIASTSNLTISNVQNSLLYTGPTGAATAATIGFPLSFSGGTLSISQANTAQNGYLSSTDWTSFNSRLSTTTLGIFDKGYFFSTTSTSAFLAQNTGLAFSTTSSDYWLTTKSLSAFSTTSANYWASVGLGFSTTSTDYWKTQNSFFSTTSALSFLSQNTGNAFSTTSASFFSSVGLAFSTTSASYFLNQNQGAAYSTTSDNYYQHTSSTVVTTYKNNSFTGTNSFQNISATGATSTSFFTTTASSSNLFSNVATFGSATVGLLTANTVGAFTLSGAITAAGNNILGIGTASTSNLTVSNIQNGILGTNGSGAVSAISFSGPISYAGGTLTITQANGTTNGYLSSADWSSFNSRLSTTTLGIFDKGYFFSTTSASAFSAAGLAFSTTSANFWSSVGLGHSTTSVAFQLSQNTTLGNSTSTTFFAATASSTNLFTNNATVGSLNVGAGTFTSALNANGGLSLGGTLTGNNNTITGIGTASTTNLTISTIQNSLLITGATGVVGAATVNSPLSFSGGTLSIAQATAAANGYLSSADWSSFNSRLSTTTLGIFDKGYFFSTTSASVFSAAGLSFSTTSTNYYLHSSTSVPATYKNNTFTGNNLFLASTTIGGGSQTSGLTIFGGATTTGNAYFLGNVGIGTTTPSARLVVVGAGFPDSFGYFDTTAAGQDSGIRFYENGTVKSHLFHAANNDTLNLQGSGTGAISINSSGTISFGTVSFTSNLSSSAAGNYLCINTSTFEVTRGNGSTCTTSDVRLKSNVAPLAAIVGLAAIEQLRPVSFNWRSTSEATTTQLGFIAQDVQNVFPNLVNDNGTTTLVSIDGSTTTIPHTLSVNYNGLIAPIVRAIQEIGNISGDFKHSLILWLADASNGIGDLFARRVRTDELCVGTTCVTPAQFQMMIDSASARSATDGAASSPEPQAEMSGGSGNPDGEATTTTP